MTSFATYAAKNYVKENIIKKQKKKAGSSKQPTIKSLLIQDN